LATDPIAYIDYVEAVLQHIELMRRLGETHFGVFDRSLIESAIARPRHAAVYDSADLIRQAAALCFGLIKNHPWVGGNKRTATHLTDRFLKLNGQEIVAVSSEILELVYAIEGDQWKVDEIEFWLRAHTHAYSKLRSDLPSSAHASALTAS